MIALSEHVKMLGGGERHLFDILAGLSFGPGDTLCIENIGASIHFRRSPAFWKIVLDAADRMGVTFFATTHNLEVAEHFAKVLATDEMADLRDRARAITLYRTKAGAVKARVREYEDFSEELESGYNIMGGG